MNETTPITVRVPTQDVKRLDALALRMDRPRSWLVRVALAQYVLRTEHVIRQEQKKGRRT